MEPDGVLLVASDRLRIDRFDPRLQGTMAGLICLPCYILSSSTVLWTRHKTHQQQSKSNAGWTTR